MESQNHYYGHSAAFARYLGLTKPRHIRGLVQHGWTTASPVGTHFRDFPTIGVPGGRRDRSLFVWSHSSRAWDPAAEQRATIAIGAPWGYLCAAIDREAAGTAEAERAGTVILPVHGIPTQRLHGDHAAVARQWHNTEGPSTVCLYHVEARDPQIVAAYLAAGHRCVTLGERTDGAFLGRLHTLLSSAQRVVSNRLSTPIVYAAAIGVDVAVHGDQMQFDGEPAAGPDRVATTWPEFFDPSASIADRRSLGRSEVGADALLAPAELSSLLGWDRQIRVGPWLDHWVLAPADRAVTNVRRHRAGSPAPAPTPAPAPAPAAEAMSAAAWLQGAISYLPHPLGRVAELVDAEPLRVSGRSAPAGGGGR